MRTWRWYSKLLFALLVAAFAYFAWPTPWQYHPTGGRLYRTHRITGVGQLWWGDGWYPTPTEMRRREEERRERGGRDPLEGAF